MTVREGMSAEIARYEPLEDVADYIRMHLPNEGPR